MLFELNCSTSHEGIPGAQSLYYYENLYPFFCHGPPVYISEEQPEPEPELFPFLALPGEIRNKIYRMCLVGPSIYSINLRFPLRRASSLLCVNKQIYYEAARIFYSGNVFRFPAVVLTSNSVQVMIENICGVRLETFGMMKRFILNIPVHSLHHGTRVVDMVSHNLDQILSFIVRWNGDNLLIQLNYELAWPVSVDPVPWGNIVCLLRSLGQFVLEKKMKIEVNLQTPFEHVEGCMDILVSEARKAISQTH